MSFRKIAPNFKLNVIKSNESNAQMTLKSQLLFAENEWCRDQVFVGVVCKMFSFIQAMRKT